MARYVILKKTRSQVNIKIVGGGSVTIPLSEFKLEDETPDSPNSAITMMHWAVSQTSGVAVVSRGSTITQYLYGTDKWELAQKAGMADTENSDEDITVEIQGGDGTVFLCLNKQGWIPPNQQATGL